MRWAIPVHQTKTPLYSYIEFEQIMVILQGQIQTRIGGQIWAPTAGDVLDVDRSAIHGNTTVTGDSDALVLDIYMPPAPVARPPRGVPASARYRS